MSAPEGTPVVLISIDTLRADRLPIYGYEGVATPALEALRRDAILYRHAFSHVPFTLPSHTSLLTGLLPPEHGVRDNVSDRLAVDRVPLLPVTFREMGYATGGFVSTYVLRSGTGLETGFDRFDDTVQVEAGKDLGSLWRPGGETLDAALAWLDTVGERPFFLFFHLYEPHTPYRPVEPFASRYGNTYEAEVASADAVVGRLLADLKRRGIYDEAIIALVSDHGEGLMDHGDPEHSLFVYREVLHVPMLLKLPGGRRGGTTVERPVQLTDVFPTLLQLLGGEAPAELAGVSLLDEPAEPRRIYSENFYTRHHFGWSELLSIIEWPYHLIYGPDPELYDLAADPGETRNILRERRREYAALRRELESMDTEPAPPSADFDPETRERLAALGYLGGGAVADDGGPRADPKSKLPTFQLMRRALDSTQEDDPETSIRLFRELLDDEPELVVAWRYLARSLRLAGRPEEALEAYRRALTVSEGAPEIARGAAELMLEMGRLDEAEEHARIALTAFPLSHEILAEVALERGDTDTALAHAARALEARGTQISPLLTQAKILLEAGDAAQAIEATEQAEREFGDRADVKSLRGLYLTRGKAYAELGDAERAIAAFRREIEIAPRTAAPYTHMALVYALTGDGAALGETLRRLVETLDNAHAYAEAVRTLRIVGDPGSAGALLRRARGRWPDDPELRELAG